jgi:hypothetical protein
MMADDRVTSLGSALPLSALDAKVRLQLREQIRVVGVPRVAPVSAAEQRLSGDRMGRSKS